MFVISATGRHAISEPIRQKSKVGVEPSFRLHEGEEEKSTGRQEGHLSGRTIWHSRPERYRQLTNGPLQRTVEPAGDCLASKHVHPAQVPHHVARGSAGTRCQRAQRLGVAIGHGAALGGQRQQLWPCRAGAPDHDGEQWTIDLHGDDQPQQVWDACRQLPRNCCQHIAAFAAGADLYCERAEGTITASNSRALDARRQTEPGTSHRVEHACWSGEPELGQDLVDAGRLVGPVDEAPGLRECAHMSTVRRYVSMRRSTAMRARSLCRGHDDFTGQRYATALGLPLVYCLPFHATLSPLETAERRMYSMAAAPIGKRSAYHLLCPFTR